MKKMEKNIVNLVFKYRCLNESKQDNSNRREV